MLWIIAAIWIAVVVFAITACVVAGRADDQLDRWIAEKDVQDADLDATFHNKVWPGEMDANLIELSKAHAWGADSQAMHRAMVEAGYAPVDEYVSRQTEPR